MRTHTRTCIRTRARAGARPRTSHPPKPEEAPARVARHASVLVGQWSSHQQRAAVALPVMSTTLPASEAGAYGGGACMFSAAGCGCGCGCVAVWQCYVLLTVLQVCWGCVCACVPSHTCERARAAAAVRRPVASHAARSQRPGALPALPGSGACCCCWRGRIVPGLPAAPGRSSSLAMPAPAAPAAPAAVPGASAASGAAARHEQGLRHEQPRRLQHAPRHARQQRGDAV